MIVILDLSATEEQIRQIEDMLTAQGLRADVSRGEQKIVIGVIGIPDDARAHLVEQFQTLPFVERVIPITYPYKRAARDYRPEGTIVRVGGVRIGEQVKEIAVIAGPCAVENEEQVLATARVVKAAGATLLRGGAYKPRTLPYDFQGLGLEGLKYLAAARAETGLPVVTEVMSPEDVETVCEYADVLQIGTRNMQNFPLLREVGKTRKPVLLKRGFAATVDEWLKAVEYILRGGNEQVILCERGIRGFDDAYTRNVLDLNVVPVLRRLTHLPIAIDPSHGTGRWYLVPIMAKAAIAVGADALMVEVHPEPARALSDAAQSLTPARFAEMMEELRPVAEAVGRCIRETS
ncbi:MAG TPA: 3-deoxy-7-phosphoheptulonate synthase [Armatimonadetes bacterium]|nr:3-deoxy-7-phosphoheptulonate synthase [Armatimonadota bacterium]